MVNMIREDRHLPLIAAVPSGCWIWTGALHREGYAHWTRKPYAGRRAHRVIYEALNGPIPLDLECDHLCPNRCCVNPAHFQIVTHRVNSLRSNNVGAINARKTTCIRGHQFVPRLRMRDGKVIRKRACLTCERQSFRRTLKTI